MADLSVPEQRLNNNHMPLSRRIKRAFYHWQTPEDLILIGTALVVGLATGLGAIAFRYLIMGVGWVGYTFIPEALDEIGKWYVVLVPAVGGLLVGLLVYFFAREAKGHGVPEVMEAVALRGGRIRPIVVIVKSLASSLSIGSGGSVGREGPIVQIGSAIGSVIGQRLHLSDDRIRNLVACGAAGGIAATFNAPIAGVIFALEVILGEFSVNYFSSVVVSSVVSSVIGRLVFGDVPAFAIPGALGINSLWEFALYPLLGILAALVGVFYTRMIYWAEDIFNRWKSVPEWVKPAVGGILLGIMALTYPRITGVTWDRIPQVFNVGYDMIEAALANQLALKVVLVLFVLKLLATSLTLGSGGSGGVFAPSLFIGAMLGLAFGQIMQILLPTVVVSPGAYALVGMAAVFSSSAHAPITAVLILFELTGDYKIILPLMLTVVLATFLARLMLKGESIYTLKLTRRGVRLQSGRDIDVLQGVSVSEVMTQQYSSITEDTPLSEVLENFNQTRSHSQLVLRTNGHLFGIITISDIDRAASEGLLNKGVARDIATAGARLVVAFPEESVSQVLMRMGSRDLTRAPVVSPEKPWQLIGMIRREDIIRAYNLGLARRSELQQRTAQKMKATETGIEFVEFVLEAGDPAVGKSLSELSDSFPSECILVSLRRDGRRLIPHGDTVFQAGDEVTAFVEGKDAVDLRECLKGDL